MVVAAWLAGAGVALAALGGTAREAVAAEPGPVTAPPTPDDKTIPEGIAQRITQAEAAFRVQNYQRVVDLLGPLIGHPKLAGRPEHVKVLEWLGAAHWFTGARDAARLAFGQLLTDEPFHQLDPFIYPEELIADFEVRRQQLIDAGVIPEKPDPEHGPNVPREVLIRTVTQHDTPTIAYLVPFGVGQFANDEDGKGATFAALQGIGVVTMAAGWLGVESLKVGNTKGIHQADKGQADTFNALWFVGVGVFVASWSFSIVDGLANRRTAPHTEERLEKLAPGELPPAAPPQVILGPGPGDLGVGVGVTF